MKRDLCQMGALAVAHHTQFSYCDHCSSVTANCTKKVFPYMIVSAKWTKSGKILECELILDPHKALPSELSYPWVFWLQCAP